MCTPTCKAFVREHVTARDVQGKTVLEVGSRAVAGPESSVRPDVEGLGPRSYIGVDIIAGPRVDEVCDVSDLRQRFGDDSFDVVITTEMLEHVRDWRAAVSNLKRVVKPGGVLVITTRSFGFPHHGWPYDYWRYELDDIREIFSDFQLEVLEPDIESGPGVFVRATKPTAFRECDLRDFRLFSIVKQRRVVEITKRDEKLFRAMHVPIRCVRSRVPQPLKRAVKRTPFSREYRARMSQQKHS